MFEIVILTRICALLCHFPSHLRENRRRLIHNLLNRALGKFPYWAIRVDVEL